MNIIDEIKKLIDDIQQITIPATYGNVSKVKDSLDRLLFIADNIASAQKAEDSPKVVEENGAEK